MRLTARQQLEQNQTQQVDIYPGRDFFPEHLFRTTVSGRQKRQRGLCQTRVRLERRLKLRQAEIQQLRLSVRGDQDVSGLEIAVDDQALMGEGNCRAHFSEQLEPLLKAGLPPSHEIGDRLPLHQFHGEVRKTIDGHPSVQEACNVGVIQPGQDLAFLLKPFDPRGRTNSRGSHFQCHALMVILLAHRFEDGSHAAGGNSAYHSIGAKQLPDHSGNREASATTLSMMPRSRWPAARSQFSREASSRASAGSE